MWTTLVLMELGGCKVFENPRHALDKLLFLTKQGKYMLRLYLALDVFQQMRLPLLEERVLELND